MEDPILDDAMEDGIPEATVETVPDHIEAGYEEPSTMDYIKYNVLGYFSNPWAMLILLFLMYKLYRLISPMITEPLAERWSQWQLKREEQAEAARYKKNPDEYKSKMEAMELARLRMQERYNGIMRMLRRWLSKGWSWRKGSENKKSKNGTITCRERAIKTEQKRELIKKEKLLNNKPELRERKASNLTTTTL